MNQPSPDRPPNPDPHPGESVADADTEARPPSCIAFESLAQGNREVIIEFRGQRYRLRQTRNGKLILNK